MSDGMKTLKGGAARGGVAWELVKLYGADGARERCCGEMLAAVEAEIAGSRPEQHCQNGLGSTTGSAVLRTRAILMMGCAPREVRNDAEGGDAAS